VAEPNPPASPSPAGAAERLLLVARVGRIISAELDLGDILQRTADAIHEVLGFENVDLPLLADESPPVLVVRVRGGAYKRHIEHEDRIPVDSGVMGAAVRERRTQVVHDVHADPRYVIPPAGIEVQGEIAVPILLGGRVLGVLNVESRAPFDALDVTILELLADQLAVAIENARLFDAERRLAVLEERQRLARELHDSVTQILWSALLVGESVAPVIGSNPDEATRRLHRMIEIVRRALGEARSLLRELSPQLPPSLAASGVFPPPSMVRLRRDGLVEALTHELRELARHGVTTGIEASTWARQSSEREEALLRVAQEALANAIRHGGARTVQIHLEGAGREVCLRVIDDGSGFDPATARTGGLGLRSMNERMRQLAGSLSISSRPGGTTVEARLPR
jgi:signal transduction histidine kinase